MPFRHTLALVLTVVSLGSASACGSNASDSGATDACAALAQARCSKRSTCTNDVGISRTFGDLGTCTEREKAGCVAALDATGTGNSPAAVQECATAIKAQLCADFLDNDLPTQCTPAGKFADGQACTFGGQCKSTYCSGTRYADCGKCAELPKAGDSCATSNCGRGLTCVASTELCQARAATGDTCDAGHPCESGLNCVGDTATATGTCQVAATTVGAACGAGLPGCAGNIGLHCTGAVGAKTCTAIKYVANGQPCGLLTDGSFAQCIRGECYGTAGVVSGNDAGTCKADAADGEACDTLLGPGCTSPARCVQAANGTSGVCTMPDAAKCG